MQILLLFSLKHGIDKVTIAQFTVVCLVPWPLSESEVEVDLVVIHVLPVFHMLIMLFLML